MRGIRLLTLTILLAIPSIAKADIRADAQRILAQTDRIEQHYKPFFTMKVPPNLPPELQKVTATVLKRAQAYANTLPPIRLYAGKIVHGDTSKETVNALNKCMYTNQTSMHELEEAINQLKTLSGQ